MRIRPSRKGGRCKTLLRQTTLAKLAQALLAMHSHPEDLFPWCLVSVIVINVIDHYSMLFLCQALPNIPGRVLTPEDRVLQGQMVQYKNS
jgi:hypothetical protein